jgi:hypothetical protein
VIDLISDALSRIDWIAKQAATYVLYTTGMILILSSLLIKEDVFGEKRSFQFGYGDFITTVLAGAFLIALGAAVYFLQGLVRIRYSVSVAEASEATTERLHEIAQAAVREALKGAGRQIDQAFPDGSAAPDGGNPMQKPLKSPGG